jgi:hypothetical protein
MALPTCSIKSRLALLGWSAQNIREIRKNIWTQLCIYEELKHNMLNETYCPDFEVLGEHDGTLPIPALAVTTSVARRFYFFYMIISTICILKHRPL